MTRLPIGLVFVVLLAGCARAPTPDPSPSIEPHEVFAPERVSDIAATLSAPIFTDPAIFEEHWIESFDGTELRIRVYRPDAPDSWKAPVIVQMSPYFTFDGVLPDQLSWLADHFVPRGYAVALSDVRGTGQSGGCLEHTGRNEAQDGFEVVEYLAAQPWSSGRVGMIGISYDAETQQATLTTAPPHLTTIVPLDSVASLYDHVFFDGVPYGNVGLSGATAYAAQGLVPPRPSPDDPDAMTAYTGRAPCHTENIANRGDTSGDYNPYWVNRDLRRRLPDVSANTSVLFVHGLEDWNVKPIHIEGWYNELPGPKHALLGQWQHEFPDQNTFRADWSREDWRFMVHRWFDHWLLDIDTGILREPAVQVQDSAGRWRFEDAWPPRANIMTLYATGEGALAPERPFGEARRTYDDNSLSFEGQGGPSVTWTGAALDADLHYSGVPRLEFTAILAGPQGGAVPASGTHFAAHLIDVDPSGAERILDRGYLDAQHRGGLDESVPVPNGLILPYTLRFHPQDDVIPNGHQLRLRIGAVDDWIQPDGTNARVTLLVGGPSPLTLSLPTVDDATARFFTPPSPPSS